jgi:hypothetical protein
MLKLFACPIGRNWQREANHVTGTERRACRTTIAMPASGS